MTLKSITQSNTGITSHAAIGASNCIPTYKAQANILIDHYTNISHRKPLQSDSRIIRSRLDHTLTPFSPQNTKHIINNIKNSPETGPDSISNFISNTKVHREYRPSQTLATPLPNPKHLETRQNHHNTETK